MTAGVITRGHFPRDLKPVVAYYFGKAYKDHPELYAKMFDSEKTSDAYEEYASYAGLSAAQLKTEGGSISYDSAQELFNQRIQILTYGLGFKVTREMIEDGKVMKFAQRKAVELKKACMDNKEIRAADVLNNAFNSSFTGADGKELCATDHPILDGTYANEPSTAADLSEAALENAIIDLRKAKNNRGLRMHVTPTMPIIPPDLEFELCRILDGKERVGTADREINALNKKSYLGMTPVINPYLTDSDAWFLKTDVDHGLIHLDRRGMEIESDNDHDTQNASYIATFRDAFFWNDPRGIYGSPGAA
jgi:hypothetical protein